MPPQKQTLGTLRAARLRRREDYQEVIEISSDEENDADRAIHDTVEQTAGGRPEDTLLEKNNFPGAYELDCVVTDLNTEDWPRQNHTGITDQIQPEEPAGREQDRGLDFDIEAGIFNAQAGPSNNGDALINYDQRGNIANSVVSLIPDVCPDHVMQLIDTLIFNVDKERRITESDACTQVIAHLFDEESGPYPKAGENKTTADLHDAPSGSKYKRMRYMDAKAIDSDGWEDCESEAEYTETGKINFASEKAGLEARTGWVYRNNSLVDLEVMFPLMNKKHITQTFVFHRYLYVPTYLDLAFQYALPEADRSWQPMQNPRTTRAAYKKFNSKAKRNAKKGPLGHDEGQAVHIEEKDFLIGMLYELADATSWDFLELLQPPEGEGDTECRCCFDTTHLMYVIQCDHGHSFCRSCVERLLGTALGDQKAPVHCMDPSECKAMFRESELKKALTPKTLNSYLALVQRKELEAAGIKNLETCPFCEYAIVMENEHEKLFRCEHPECAVVSCRSCKRHNHIPRTCVEVAADDKLDKRHSVEEAMTEALVRKCPKPKCQKPFLKESGCNKITCTTCNTVSCYVCRQIVTDGYKHFNQGNVPTSNLCRLWDSYMIIGGDPYVAEVAAARQAAQDRAFAEAAAEGYQIAQADVDVALPGPVAAAPLVRPLALENRRIAPLPRAARPIRALHPAAPPVLPLAPGDRPIAALPRAALYAPNPDLDHVNPYH